MWHTISFYSPKRRQNRQVLEKSSYYFLGILELSEICGIRKNYRPRYYNPKFETQRQGNFVDILPINLAHKIVTKSGVKCMLI